MLSTLASNFVRFGGYPQKDTSNTALSLHPLSPGRVLARMEQSLPTELTVSKGGEVATVLPFSTLGGTLPLTNPISGGALSAHSRTCPETGEVSAKSVILLGKYRTRRTLTPRRLHRPATSKTFSISYGTTPPFLRLDRYTPPGSHSSHPIPVPAPVFLHDLELTPSYVVVLDLPLTVRPSRLAFNAFPVAYEPSNGARVGLFSRKTAGVEWWEVEACVVLHCAGAAEAADGSVTLRALRSVPDGDRSYIQSYTPAYLHEWRIGPEKGAVTERRLSDVMMEFPVPCGSDGAFLALRVRSIEGPLLLHCSPETGILLDGVVKFDGSGRQVATYDAEDGWWCVSEPTVCGKYATVMVSNVAKDVGSYGDGFDGMATKVVVLDLESLEKVAEQEAAKTGYGLHSLWLPWDSHVEESNEV